MNQLRVLDEDTVRVRVRLCVGVTVEDFVLLAVCVRDAVLDGV